MKLHPACFALLALGACSSPLRVDDYPNRLEEGAYTVTELDYFGWGMTASMGSSVQIQCNGDQVATCASSDNSSSAMLWDAQVETVCETIEDPSGGGGQCCFCEVSMAYASGFRSIGVEGGGFGLEVSGSLGVGGAIKRQQQKCCP